MAARLLLALAGLLLLGVAPPSPERCESLKNAAIANVEIVIAEQVGGTFAGPDGTRLAVTSLCRVRGIARPEPASHVTFELWLPAEWNGRYYQLGNGGFAGNIHFPSLAAEAARGNAAAVTDTGHSGTGQFDASWARGHPERVKDYGHRSIKATSDAAAALIRTYYGRPADKRYFVGCSNGGRQALMAAQYYPDDWEGIIAGAPAVYFSRQLAAFADVQHALRVEPLGFIPPAKLPAIQAAALASCPAGSVESGVALEPRHCRLKLHRLLCAREDRIDCLTVPQLDSLRSIVAAGYQPTSAAGPDGWASWIVNPDPAAPSQLVFAEQGFRYLLQDRPEWQLSDRRPYGGLPAGDGYPDLDASSLDYFRFRDRGGKIIAYFGWGDPLLSPQRMLEHYLGVRGMMGRKDRARFFRLFMVPGMAHCQGGTGPVSFGQSIPAPAAVADPRHDIRLALEAWVERGLAPDVLIAASYRGGDPANGVEASRTLLPHR